MPPDPEEVCLVCRNRPASLSPQLQSYPEALNLTIYNLQEEMLRHLNVEPLEVLLMVRRGE